jgi:hypothetical protein
MMATYGVQTVRASDGTECTSIPLAHESWDEAEAQRRFGRQVEQLRESGFHGTIQVVKLNARGAVLKSGRGELVTL